MSDLERPEAAAFRELDLLVRHLGEELATFRRRALNAENQLRALDADGGNGAASPRVVELQTENAALRGRLDAAAERARTLLNRVRFLRQQVDRGDRGGNR